MHKMNLTYCALDSTVDSLGYSQSKLYDKDNKGLYVSRVKGQSCLKVVIQPVMSELILEEDSEVHVFHRVHHDVDELHTGHLVGRQSTFLLAAV